jgi:hypothetical protein
LTTNPRKDSYPKGEVPLHADAFFGGLGEALGKPERIGRGAVELVVLEPFAAFGDRGNAAHRNPPQAVVGLIHFFKPPGAVLKNFSVVRPVRVIAQRLNGLPHGHVDDDEGIVVIGDVGSVPGFRFEPPDKAGGRIGDGIDGVELRNETRDLRVVNGSNQASDIDLRELEGHGELLGGIGLPKGCGERGEGCVEEKRGVAEAQ